MQKSVEYIRDRVSNLGGQAYFVGGYVRDLLMGVPPKDIDIVVTGLTPDQLRSAFDTDFVGKSFPVVVVKGHEVALARKERSTGPRQGDFECNTENVTLEEDLLRRDLTVNAIAMDMSGNIIDPYNGRQHIKNLELHNVSHAFAEDPLRVLRAARFAAQLGFTPSRSLEQECRALRRTMLDQPGERFYDELTKALRTPRPSRFFTTLSYFWMLDIVFPEIEALKGRVQPPKYHPEGDAYVHTLQVVNRARELGADDASMFAALVHDLGKAVTPDHELPHHYNHEALGVPLVEEMCQRLRVPNGVKKLAVIVTREHLRCHRFLQMKPHKQVDLIMALKGHEEQFTLVCKADAQGRGEASREDPYPQREAVLRAAEVVRSVKGHQFAHLNNGLAIAQKMREARANALKAALLMFREPPSLAAPY